MHDLLAYIFLGDNTIRLVLFSVTSQPCTYIFQYVYTCSTLCPALPTVRISVYQNVASTLIVWGTYYQCRMPSFALLTLPHLKRVSIPPRTPVLTLATELRIVNRRVRPCGAHPIYKILTSRLAKRAHLQYLKDSALSRLQPLHRQNRFQRNVKDLIPLDFDWSR